MAAKNKIQRTRGSVCLDRCLQNTRSACPNNYKTFQMSHALEFDKMIELLRRRRSTYFARETDLSSAMTSWVFCSTEREHAAPPGGHSRQKRSAAGARRSQLQPERPEQRKSLAAAL